ncbi:TetR/AcrR family transcriptional regulator [Ferrimonas balearica]|uniref:TetR/AcrR family transcriptional regulator n=1 Tax=Ferrimonas balearica TaxID=44012 RepID=UPI001C99756F|nr:TetR/AcrR family transcriptional regulator [Ferrimonas balearica]MBY5992203.1 TetR/AcrR family transcriptional regulator [Ferrimonas balearica]
MTVKAKKRGRPSQLSSEGILDCAKTLLRQEGKVPSVRAISGALGVDPMAIYHYFGNKAALLDALCRSLVADIHQPDGGDWRIEIEALCRSYLGLLEAHPGLLGTLLGLTSTGPAQVFIERFEQALAPLALPPITLAHCRDLLVDYLHGYALAQEAAAGALTQEALSGPLEFWMTAVAQAAKA